jgi:hypothetical protein
MINMSNWTTPQAEKIIKERRASEPRNVREQQKHFAKVPALWVERLAKARHIATYRVALHVLYQNWKRGGAPFALSNRAVEGVNRSAKWRALIELEQLGLITIERRPNRSPKVSPHA